MIPTDVLTQDDIARIENLAKDILITAFGSFDAISLPITLDHIIEQQGITLKYGDFGDPDVSGAYEKEKKMVLVANDEPSQRKTFTIAHELGHFFLHKHKKEEAFYRTQMLSLDNEKKKEEAEANWFAASLLMPEASMKKYWDLSHNIDEMSVVFGVSPIAVYYRLKNLLLSE